MLEKNLSNDKSLEVYAVISQKNLSCTFFDKKTDKKQNEQKSWELTVWKSLTNLIYYSTKKKSQKAAIVIHETHVMNQKISEFLK